MGLKLYATEGTAKYLKNHGIEVEEVSWPGEGQNDVIKAIKEGLVDMVINIPKSTRRQELTRGSQIRQAAVRFGCPLLTNMEKVAAFVQSINKCQDFIKDHKVLSLPPYKL